MKLYNKKGVCCNTEDTEEGLVEALDCYFDDVEVAVTASVALFVARKPVSHVHRQPFSAQLTGTQRFESFYREA